ncbi:MAG: DUF4172 domain-containing protein, partial [Candidatus Margulisiibacteriota bacterium]
MLWNWQQKDWPAFSYDQQQLQEYEVRFLNRTGLMIGATKHLDDAGKQSLKIDLISDEALSTSEIEGEYLDRDSVQSSIRRMLGLATDSKAIPPAEQGIAEMMM